MVDTRVDTCQRQSLAHNEGKLSLSRLVVLVETSQTLPSVLFFFATAYCIQFLTKQDPSVIDVNHTRFKRAVFAFPLFYMGHSSQQVNDVFDPVLFTVHFLKNLLCTFNSLQPMKYSYFPLRYKLSRVALGAQEAQLRNSWFATTWQDKVALLGGQYNKISRRFFMQMEFSSRWEKSFVLDHRHQHGRRERWPWINEAQLRNTAPDSRPAWTTDHNQSLQRFAGISSRVYYSFNSSP